MEEKAFKCMDKGEYEKYKKGQFDQIKDHLRSDGSSQPARKLKTDSDLKRSSYKSDHPNRGLAIIFNNMHFERCEKRSNADKDEGNLASSLRSLKFDVITFRDLKGEQILDATRDAAQKYKHEKADCFVCVLMSHGALFRDSGGKDDYFNHGLLASDDAIIGTKEILDMFDDEHCPGLANKPRIFFIQACRSYRYSENGKMKFLQLYDEGASSESERLEKNVRKNIPPLTTSNNGSRIALHPVPLYQDCLIMHATPPGYPAWRGVGGSWLVQELHKVLQRHDKIMNVSFLSVLTIVSNAVVENYKSHIPSNHLLDGKKQMPVIEARLTKDIIMTQKDREDHSLDFQNLSLSN